MGETAAVSGVVLLFLLGGTLVAFWRSTGARGSLAFVLVTGLVLGGVSGCGASLSGAMGAVTKAGADAATVVDQAGD